MLPGVFKRKEGGCLVRARVTERVAGRTVEIRKVLPDADEPSEGGHFVIHVPLPS